MLCGNALDPADFALLMERDAYLHTFVADYNRTRLRCLDIYLHYVFDLWAERWRRHYAQGNIILGRYATDIVAGFEHQADAERFQAELRDRLAQFALTLHPDKTRLIQFGRRAAEDRERAGLGKPETFDFLGFSVLQRHTERSSP